MLRSIRHERFVHRSRGAARSMRCVGNSGVRRRRLLTACADGQRVSLRSLQLHRIKPPTGQVEFCVRLCGQIRGGPAARFFPARTATSALRSAQQSRPTGCPRAATAGPASIGAGAVPSRAVRRWLACGSPRFLFLSGREIQDFEYPLPRYVESST